MEHKLTKLRFFKSLLFISFFLLASICHSNENSEKGFTSNIKVATSYNDNVFGTQSKRSDTNFVVSPTLNYEGKYGKHELNAAYEGEYGFYSKIHSAKYDNHIFKSNIKLRHSARWKSLLVLDLAERIEKPGSNNQTLIGLEEFNELRSSRFALQTSYGSPDSAGELAFRYIRRDFGYRNNNQSFRDRTEDEYRPTFYWRIAPKTRAQFQIRYNKVKSDNDFGFNQSAEQTSYLVGAIWEITSKLDTSFLVGLQDTDFEDPDIETINGFSYFIDASYKIDTDSTLDISLSRATRDNASSIIGGLESSDVTIEWKKSITKRLFTNLSAKYRIDDFSGESFSRRDTNTNLEVQIGYSANRKIDIYFSYNRVDRNSDFRAFEFSNNQVSLGLKVFFG